MTTKVWQIGTKEYAHIPTPQQASIINWFGNNSIDFDDAKVIFFDEGGALYAKVYKRNEAGERFLDPECPGAKLGHTNGDGSKNPSWAAYELIIVKGIPPFSNVFRKYGTEIDLETAIKQQDEMTNNE